MQHFELWPHPSCRPRAVRTIEVFVYREPESVMFEFNLLGDIAAIVIGEELPQVRCDRLWESTCFEAFLRPDGGQGYYELNYAPTTQWASYQFDSYRVGMRAAAITPDAKPFLLEDEGIFEAMPRFDFAGVADLTASIDWHVNLAAVIEEIDGNKSYWALAHTGGPPDFHNPACFVARVPAIARS